MTTFNLAGVKYRDIEAQTLAADLRLNDSVFLEPDTMNEHDAFAVRVLAGNPLTMIGYVPRGTNEPIFEDLLNGKQYSCTVVAVSRRGPKIEYKVSP